MPAYPFTLKHLLAHHGGRHFASEPHLRLQVLPVRPGQQDGDLFRFHGALLLICLAGDAVVRTETEAHPLAQHDQVLLTDGEPFAVGSTSEDDAVVQFVWTPGPSFAPSGG